MSELIWTFLPLSIVVLRRPRGTFDLVSMGCKMFSFKDDYIAFQFALDAVYIEGH